MQVKGHNASHYFYVHPTNKPEWKKDLHKIDMDDLLGFDPFTNGNPFINGKKYFQHLNMPTANCSFQLTTIYPGILIGAGYSHYAIKGEGEDSDYQLGFFFDHTLGIPIIPGSSVKGVLKSVFPISGKNRAAKLDYVYNLVRKENDKISKEYLLENWEEIFFKNDNVFFHAFPVKIEKDNESKNEFDEAEKQFQNSHEKFEQNKQDLQKKLNNANNDQKKKLERDLKKLESNFKESREKFDAAELKYKISQRILVDDAITPHHPGDPNDIFKEPIPLKFIKVPAGVTFKFQFKINNYKNGDINISADAIKNIFKQILLDFGICAKRNVGYGHFTE